MSVAATEAIQFRCQHCWQCIYTDIEQADSNVSCPHCDCEVPVPAATPERLCDSTKIPEPEPRETKPLEELSEAELMRIVKHGSIARDCDLDFSGFANATPAARLTSFLVDRIVEFVAIAFGFCFVLLGIRFDLVNYDHWDPTGNLDMAAACFFCFPIIVLYVFQWNMIASKGQTIGKIVTNTRIVTLAGRTPGILRGVVLRNWLRNLLAAIPLFWLVDNLFVYSPSARCLRDYLAGTRVISQ